MLKYGFFNSLNHDRVYDAEDMSAIFNNIITDGVFDNYGKIFATRAAGGGMGIIVGSGRAWFDSTWTMSDSDIALTLPAADVSMTRIDSVILEVNHATGTRANSIKILKGTPSSNPTPPVLAHSADLFQHSLANITLAPGTTVVTDSMIDIRVGKSDCPFVTSVLQSVSIDALFAKWENDFTTWFDDLKAQLAGNVASNLQNQIDQTNTKVDNNYNDLNGKISNLDTKKLDASTYNSGYSTLNSLISAAQKTADGKITAEYGSYTGDGNGVTISVSKGTPIAIAISGNSGSNYAQSLVNRDVSYVSMKGCPKIWSYGEYSSYKPSLSKISWRSDSIRISQDDSQYSPSEALCYTGYTYSYIVWIKT